MGRVLVIIVGVVVAIGLVGAGALSMLAASDADNPPGSYTPHPSAHPVRDIQAQMRLDDSQIYWLGRGHPVLLNIASDGWDAVTQKLDSGATVEVVTLAKVHGTPPVGKVILRSHEPHGTMVLVQTDDPVTPSLRAEVESALQPVPRD